MSTNKVEVVDFLINVLKDHEEILGALIDKVESLIEKNQTRNYELLKINELPNVSLSIQEWYDFRLNALYPEFVCFEIEDSSLIISAKKRNVIFTYHELITETFKSTFIQDSLIFNESDNKINRDIQQINGQLRSGIDIILSINQEMNENGVKKNKISFHLDTDLTKKWISKQLNIKKNLIFNGKIEN